eukprot:scaffold208019_cov18-Tisochrysis_lutea.AAC.1
MRDIRVWHEGQSNRERHWSVILQAAWYVGQRTQKAAPATCRGCVACTCACEQSGEVPEPGLLR